MKNKLEKVFENIHASQKSYDIIMNKTINKKNNLILQKSMITLAVIILIFTSYGIVKAIINVKVNNNVRYEENKLFTTITLDRKNKGLGYRDTYITVLKLANKKELNYDANINIIEYTGDELKITKNELEENLNIKFLTSDKLINKKMIINRLRKENQKISEMIMGYIEPITTNNSKIKMGMTIITKYYNSEIYDDIIGQTHDEDYAYKEIIKNDILNTDLYFYSMNTRKSDIIDNDTVTSGTLSVYFIYDDILYSLGGRNISVNDLINVVNSLHY